mmetsp:Transcript_5792/g.20495  ORF Transcript_5792/g.20495 Transcript_5792/m.20495 type:complete len:145 (-) Transcript_5792:356-790(-)
MTTYFWHNLKLAISFTLFLVCHCFLHLHFYLPLYQISDWNSQRLCAAIVKVSYFGICPAGLFLKESAIFEGAFSFSVIEATFLAACSATEFLLSSTKFLWPGYIGALPPRLSFFTCDVIGFDSCSFSRPLMIDCSLTDILLSET